MIWYNILAMQFRYEKQPFSPENTPSRERVASADREIISGVRENKIEKLREALGKQFENSLSRTVKPEAYQDSYDTEQVNKMNKLYVSFRDRAEAIKNLYLSCARRFIMSGLMASLISFAGAQEQTDIPNTPENVKKKEFIDPRNPDNFLYDIEKHKQEMPSVVRIDTLSQEQVVEFRNESPLFNGEFLNNPDGHPHALAEYEEITKQYNDIREWSKNLIESPVYQARLSYELKESNLTGAETFYIQKRLSNLLETDYLLETPEDLEIESGAEGYYTKKPYQHDKPGLTFLESVDAGQTTLPYTISLKAKTTAAHEYEHEAVDVGENFYHEHVDGSTEAISPYAQELYREGFNNELWERITSKALAAGMLQEDIDELYEYYSSTTEMQAFKRGATYELNQQGIWNYDEEFTEETYEKVMNYIEQESHQDLGSSAFTFFKFIKKEQAIKIFNTIA